MLWLVASESEKALSCGSRNRVSFLGSHSSLNHSRQEDCEHTVPAAFGVAWQVKGYSFRNRQRQGNSLQETWGNSNLAIGCLCSATAKQEAVFSF